MSLRREIFFRHLAQTSEYPPGFEFIRAEGSYLYDASGKKYLDLISGISVSSLGHGNERIKKAIHTQVDQHLHLMVYGEYIIPAQVDLVNELSKNLPPNLQSIYLTNSGSEATEGAMKIAKRFTGRTGFVSFRNSYHGSTQGALSICGNESLKNAYRPLLPGHLLLEYNSFDQLELIDESIAAVFIEPIQAEAGVILPAEKYLEALKEQCNRKKVLLVFDEIQTGMGRTGSLFAFDKLKVIPDILLLGKAFGGGMPLGAFISSNEIMSKLTHDPALGHMTTSGGHPASCAAALASLQIITSDGLISEIQKKGELLRSLLKHDKIREVRGKGLFLSVEFDSEKLNHKVIQNCYENGLITDWFLFAPNCLRIVPPLIISEEEIKSAASIINRAIEVS